MRKQSIAISRIICAIFPQLVYAMSDSPPENNSTITLQFDPCAPQQGEAGNVLMDEMMALMQESQSRQNFMPSLMPPEPMPPEPIPQLTVVENVDDLPQDFLAMLHESQNPFHAQQNRGAPVSAKPVEVAETQDLMAIFQRGGVDALNLMQYCVRAINLDPLFVALVREYQLRPSHQALLALYDCFCAPHAPGKLSISEVLAAQELRLQSQTALVRAEWQRMQQPVEPVPEEENAPRQRSTVPNRSMFDALLSQIQQSAKWQATSQYYKPELSPNQNLPGGDITPVQLHFVTRVWRPVIRPRLVAAGFWRIATVE